MALHDLEFLCGQFAGFEQNAVGNADLADIVQKSADHQIGNLLFRQVHRLGQSDCIVSDPVVVGVGIRIPLGNGVAEGVHQGEIGVQQASGQPGRLLQHGQQQGIE